MGSTLAMGLCGGVAAPMRLYSAQNNGCRYCMGRPFCCGWQCSQGQGGQKARRSQGSDLAQTRLLLKHKMQGKFSKSLESRRSTRLSLIRYRVSTLGRFQGSRAREVAPWPAGRVNVSCCWRDFGGMNSPSVDFEFLEGVLPPVYCTCTWNI